MEQVPTKQLLCCGHLFTANNTCGIAPEYIKNLHYKEVFAESTEIVPMESKYQITHAVSSSVVASGKRSFMLEVIFL
jgi:hypothetical protein